jgi:RND superfamily putative drug exporter
VLWIVPLLVVGVADGLARIVVGSIASATGLPVDGSISGILSVLVFGAGTNYALLLVARYREELRRRQDRFEAMRAAVTGAGPAIVASGGTVALSLASLSLAELAGNRALGIACAIGILIAMAFALVVLPVALVVCGRGLFWPFVPRASTEESERGFWLRLGRGVSRRPLAVAAVSIVAIGILALGLGGYRVGLSQTDQLIGTPESVAAQAVIDDAFGAGSAGGTVVLAPESDAQRVLATVEDTAGVARATAGESAAGYTRIDVSLDGEPQSDDAFATIRALRSEFQALPAPSNTALVGGLDATQLDYRDAAARDLGLIAPVILGIVAVILALLLRSLLAPLLLLSTVLGTFFASLGASTWIFTGILGFPAFDTSVTLFSFLFLVALGVDYNIFLTTRAREERAAHGTREGMVRAVSSTGAVITSAGVLLAAVFAVLGVLPVVALAQIGVIVCIGVLLDTLVVRTLLVPSLVFLLGERFWWPWRPSKVSARH